MGQNRPIYMTFSLSGRGQDRVTIANLVNPLPPELFPPLFKFRLQFLFITYDRQVVKTVHNVSPKRVKVT